MLFAERDGTQAAAQIKVFDDTWRWDEGAARAYADVVEAGGRVSQAMQAFRTFLGESDMLAYLAMEPGLLMPMNAPACMDTALRPLRVTRPPRYGSEGDCGRPARVRTAKKLVS